MVLGAVACGRDKPAASTSSGTGALSAVASLADSLAVAPAPELALTVKPGLEIWFTDSRPADDGAGNTCTERVMEIRRDGKRIPVPLLYTGATPKRISDSTIEAAIWLHCRPGNVYQVNLQTGQPSRVR